MNAPKQIRKVAVLGGGSAGFLAALAFAKHLPEIEIVVVRSTKLGVIGVGEGTIPSVVTFIHRFLGLDLQEFNREARPSIKLGIKYLWGERPYFHYTFSPQCTRPHPSFPIPKGYLCQEEFDFADLTSALMNFDKVALRDRVGIPKLNPSFAYHVENRQFVSYFEGLADQHQVKKIDALVADVVPNADGIQALILDNGDRIEADLFLDCSGFRAELIGRLKEPFESFDNALFCDRAVVGGWARTENDTYHPFTTAETMDAGWAWQIEHDELVNRGYVFCSKFIEDERAIEEFKAKNPKLDDARVIQFRAGVHRRTWVDNVVAIGNAAGFVEPIEATAIGVICDSVSRLVRGLKASNGRFANVQREVFNQIVYRNWTTIRDFIALHYKFNNRLDTPFWKTCRNEVELGEAQQIADYYQLVGPDLGYFGRDLKNNLFTSEGYIAILLGQRVGYARDPGIDSKMSEDWQKFKLNLAKGVQKNGLEMAEYLEFLRNSEVRPAEDSESTTDGFAENPGELNWH